MSLLLPPPGGDARQVATAVNQALKGKVNSSGTAVLAANATSTTVINEFIGNDSIVLLMPQTQNAAADSLDNATYVDPTNYVEGVSFAISHANNTKSDRVFGYVILGSGSPAIDPATVALVAQMTVQPSAVRTAIIDTAIRALKAAGIWSKMALLYVTTAHDQQAALLNWVNPGTATLSAVAGPSFTTDRGYSGDGVSKYLDSGVAINTLSPYAQNAAHAGGWSLSAGAVGSNPLGTNGALFVNVRTDATRNTRVNGSTNTGTTDVGTTTGHVVAVRRDAATLYSYRNGGSEFSAASASSSPVTNTISLLKNSTGFSDIQVAVGHVGDQLSATDVSNLYAILQSYLHAVGAV